MFHRDAETYVYPEGTLHNVNAFLEFVQEQGWTESELYFVLKLVRAMFD